MSSRRAGLLLLWLTSLALSGCEWISSLGIPQAIREKGLLTALEEPMPLDQPFDDSFSQFQVEHDSEMRTLLARMAEFAEELQNPMQRDAYVQSLKAGGPSRARAFYALYVNQSGGIASSDKQFALWERIDRALAEGSEPELLEDRIIALAALVAHAEPTTAARLTAAIRDDWNPESENWHLVFAAIYQPSDTAWAEAWRTASQKNLDNEMGEAILERVSWSETTIISHPFVADANFALLTERMRQSTDPEELNRIVGVLGTLDINRGRELWQAAAERPAGRARLTASFECWRRIVWPPALDYLKRVAAEEEGYAIFALDLISRRGQLEGLELPTGERLARAKAYHAIVEHLAPPDGVVEGIVLTPIAVGKTRANGDDMELTLFRFSVPASALPSSSTGAEGFVVVDERLVLSPDESQPAVDPTAVAEAANDFDAPSLDAAFDETTIRDLRQQGAVTVLDVIAWLDPALRRNGYTAGVDMGMQPGIGQQLLDQDDRWKAFDIPLDSLGLDLKERNETEPVEPEGEAAPAEETTPEAEAAP